MPLALRSRPEVLRSGSKFSGLTERGGVCVGEPGELTGEMNPAAAAAGVPVFGVCSNDGRAEDGRVTDEEGGS